MIQITFNSHHLSIALGTNVVQLLEAQGIQGRFVAVAINQQIVKASEWSNTILSAGDNVIVLGAIKGG